jgi:serine/threonine protein kinase
MLSGERAFRGETAADTMTAILTKDPPDLDIARLSIAPGLDRIVRRCLEKKAELRFQSANDLAFALENLSTSSTTSSPAEVAVPARRGPPSWLPWTVAALAIVASMVGWFARAGEKREPRWDYFRRITETAGEETSPTLVARRHHRWLCDSRERKLGHLCPAGRRPQRDDDRERSAA